MDFFSLQRLTADYIVLQEKHIKARKAERESFDKRMKKYKEREM